MLPPGLESMPSHSVQAYSPVFSSTVGEYTSSRMISAVLAEPYVNAA